VKGRHLTAAAAVAACALATGCAGGSGQAAAKRPVVGVSASCPAAWRSGWQALANRIQTPVYCPAWMPNPLDAKIGGQWFNGTSVDKRTRSYLVSFLWHESQSGDVHVNLRGYPGQTSIPTCTDTRIVSSGSTRRVKLPCFADPRGHRRVRGIDATVYTVNQDADQWHVLYAWRRNGSLYTVSEHVTRPLTYAKVVTNLDRMLRSLVLIRPTA
jgi:hypothetical protein